VLRAADGAMMLDRRAFLRGAGAGLALALGKPEMAAAKVRTPRAAGNAFVLVTADLDGFVAVVDVRRRRIVRRVATLDGPRSIEARAGAGSVVVGHAGAGAVTLLDGPPMRVRRVLRGFGEPRYAAIAPGGRHAFVSDSAHGELAVVDLRRGRVIARLGVGDGARHLTLDPRGRTLWIALGSTATVLVVVDVSSPARPRVVRRIQPPFGAHDVVFSPSGARVWVTAGRTRQLALYRATARQPAAIIAADAAPQHVAFGARVAYVASGEGRSLTAHALDDGRVLHRARTPLGSYNVARGAGVVVTPSLASGALTVLDGAGRPRWSVNVADAAHDACVIAA
jgi:DNA-binding beta-propeller fold protein YncE